MEFCMSIFSPRNFNDIPQSVCVKEVWEGGMRGKNLVIMQQEQFLRTQLTTSCSPSSPPRSCHFLWHGRHIKPPPPEQKQRYLPRKSFWPHFDTSHNFTKTSPDNLSVVLTFKYALIPPSWKNSQKFSNRFVEFDKTMRGILTYLLWYSLSFSEGFEWVINR